MGKLVRLQQSTIVFWASLLVFDNFVASPLLDSVKADWLSILLFKVLELSFGIIMNALMLKQQIFLTTKLGKNSIVLLTVMAVILLCATVNSHGSLRDSLVIGSCAAISEEYWFRGVIFGHLLSRLKPNERRVSGIIKCMLMTSLLFSLAHLTNLDSQSLQLTIVQMIEVFGMSFLFCAAYVRTGNLLIPICLHFSIDYLGTMTQNVNHQPTTFLTSALSVILFLGIYIGLGLVVLEGEEISKWRLMPHFGIN
ncbi:CPBP family intramembrane metalloprotease (plasmid) [Lactobacillus paracasei] [Lactiplantibacillus mudanjiangensis]|uniref:CPBP family intramembrane glutamic endopeptidase n=1 Tax=Lactiplantibacillus mudanjiangensis TaxID=1296538 RepID=UPI0010159759|nr:CPBP family intramembrane metalloprotease (plasmid) [Lactobacillus paracasei] [Lactiplantibacillus mudanjiangensis]